VIAPANTGKDNNNKKAVINTAQTYKGNLCINIPGLRILKIVTIKLIAPKIEDAPAICKLKIAKSTEGPECACPLANGGILFIQYLHQFLLNLNLIIILMMVVIIKNLYYLILEMPYQELQSL